MAGDAGDGGTGGSGLRLQGLSEGWGGEDEVCEKPKPLFSFYKSSRAAEGSFPSNFAIIANLSLACITRKSNFQYLITNNIINKNYHIKL